MPRKPPEPFYRDDWITLYLGDCAEILRRLPRSERFDLLLTDPPWKATVKPVAGHRKSPSLGRFPGLDGEVDVEARLDLAIRRLRPKRHLYVFGPEFDADRYPVGPPAELIWDRGHWGPGNLKQPWGRSHDPITFAVFVSSKVERKDRRGSLTARLRRDSVLRDTRPCGQAVKRHPTEKPVGILRQMIESSSMLGETVLDPFAGSGSTLVAAALEGRRSVGIEIEKRFCKVIVERAKRVQIARET